MRMFSLIALEIASPLAEGRELKSEVCQLSDDVTLSPLAEGRELK